MLSSFFRFLVVSCGSGSSPGGPTNFNSVKNLHSEGARGSLQVRVTLPPRTLTSFNNPKYSGGSNRLGKPFKSIPNV